MVIRIAHKLYSGIHNSQIQATNLIKATKKSEANNQGHGSSGCQAGVKPINVVLLHFDADVGHFTRCCLSCRDGCKCANIHLYLVTLCYQLNDPCCMGTSCAKLVSTLTAIWCVHCAKAAANTSADISLVRRYVIHWWLMHYGTSCAKMVVKVSTVQQTPLRWDGALSTCLLCSVNISWRTYRCKSQHQLAHI